MSIIKQNLEGFSAGLRAMADLMDNLAANEKDFPILARELGRWVPAVHIDVFPTDLVGATRELKLAAGGPVTKHSEGSYFVMRKSFGSEVNLDLNRLHSQVCERKVVGTRTVERPDPDAPKITVEEEVVEWVCPQVLAEDAS